jgi:hypothetical protein
VRCCQLSFVGWTEGVEVKGEWRDGKLKEVRRVVAGERSLRVVRFGRVASEVWRMETAEVVELEGVSFIVLLLAATTKVQDL